MVTYQSLTNGDLLDLSISHQNKGGVPAQELPMEKMKELCPMSHINIKFWVTS